MIRIKISGKEVKEHLNIPDVRFPMYVKQIINLANLTSKATRPRNVGQMTELIKQFTGKTYFEWCDFYEDRHPNAIEYATQKICEMIKKFKSILDLIDEKIVRRWVEDLVKNKTFTGLKFQEAIFKELSTTKGLPYRLADVYEEAKGIDGYVGDQAYQVKSKFNKVGHYPKTPVEGVINIYYQRSSGGGLIFEFDE